MSDTPDYTRPDVEEPLLPADDRAPVDEPEVGLPTPATTELRPQPTVRGRWSIIAGRVAYFCLDLLGIAGWTWLAVALPLPVFNEFLSVKNTVVAFVAVVWIGRTIVDTFFYDRHPW